MLTGQNPTLDPTPSKFIDSQALRIGASARIAGVLALAPFAELGRVGDQLDVLLTPQALARALSAGLDGDAMRIRIEAIAPLPDTISRMLIQASAVVGRGAFTASSGFLWVEDVEIRELLRTRRPAAELFLDPSPPGGLLVAPDIDADRLVRRCRSLGVEVETEGGVFRAAAPRSLTPPPAAVAAKAGTPADGVRVPSASSRPRASKGTIPPARR